MVLQIRYYTIIWQIIILLSELTSIFVKKKINFCTKFQRKVYTIIEKWPIIIMKIIIVSLRAVPINLGPWKKKCFFLVSFLKMGQNGTNVPLTKDDLSHSNLSYFHAI